MKKLSAKGQRWLKCLHIYSACVWLGCATALAIMQFIIKPTSGDELHGSLSALYSIDILILVPGAIGTLLTAIVYSTWTNWGWFKHRWIVVKWIICIFGMFFGTFYLGPWLSEMSEISKIKGMDALTDPQYLGSRFNIIFFGSLQTLTVVFAMFISTLKPWRKKKSS